MPFLRPPFKTVVDALRLSLVSIASYDYSPLNMFMFELGGNNGIINNYLVWIADTSSEYM